MSILGADHVKQAGRGVRCVLKPENRSGHTPQTCRLVASELGSFLMNEQTANI